MYLYPVYVQMFKVRLLFDIVLKELVGAHFEIGRYRVPYIWFSAPSFS